jgi:hypothetical protein
MFSGLRNKSRHSLNKKALVSLKISKPFLSGCPYINIASG